MYSKGVIFKRTLQDNRKSMFWWSFGIALMGLYVVVAFPFIEGLEDFARVMDTPIFRAVLGDIGELDWTTPEGFLGIELFSWIPLIFAVYAVMFGVGITGGEESNGTVDILLSTPTPRWQVIVERFLAYIVAVFVILTASMMTMWVAMLFTPEMQSAIVTLLWGVLNIIPPMLLIGALALFLATVLPSPGQAGNISAAIIAASYFLNSLADMTNSSVMKALQSLSFYKYYAPFRVLTDGINWANFGLLIAVAAILFGLSIYFYERRDLLSVNRV